MKLLILQNKSRKVVYVPPFSCITKSSNCIQTLNSRADVFCVATYVEISLALHSWRGQLLVYDMKITSKGCQRRGKLFMQTQHPHTLSTVAVHQSENATLLKSSKMSDSNDTVDKIKTYPCTKLFYHSLLRFRFHHIFALIPHMSPLWNRPFERKLFITVLILQ